MIPTSIFDWPVAFEVTFSELASFIQQLGGTSSEADGIAKYSLSGRRLFLQRPDERQVLKHYQTEALRDFLVLTNVIS